MGYRKFSYDDAVTVLPGSDYEAHVGHIGRITAVRIERREAKKGTKVNYHVSSHAERILFLKQRNWI